MKNLTVHLFWFLLLYLPFIGLSQEVSKSKSYEVISVSFDKLTVVRFDFEVKDVLVGNEDMLEAPFKGKVIYLRALMENFGETNIVVTLQSSELFAFDIVYSAHIAKSMWYFPSASAVSNGNGNNTVAIPTVKMNDSIVTNKVDSTILVSEETKPKNTNEFSSTYVATEEMLADKILKAKNYIHSVGVRNTSTKITGYVGGVWNNKNNMYLKVGIVNESQLILNIQKIGIVVRQKRAKAKRETKQDYDVPIKKIFNEPKVISPGEKQVFVVMFESLILQNDKKIMLHVLELDGARDVEIEMDVKHFYEAKVIN